MKDEWIKRADRMPKAFSSVLIPVIPAGKRKPRVMIAAHLGVSAAFVNDIVRGNREPSGKVLKHLGLSKDVRRVVIFFKP